MKRMLSVIFVVALLAPGQIFAQMNGEEVYKKACGSCHNSGIAGAPKLGDKEAWAPRISEGMDELYGVAINGEGAMPAKGGRKNLSDDEVKAAVDYMVEKSK